MKFSILTTVVVLALAHGTFAAKDAEADEGPMVSLGSLIEIAKNLGVDLSMVDTEKFMPVVDQLQDQIKPVVKAVQEAMQEQIEQAVMKIKEQMESSPK